MILHQLSQHFGLFLKLILQCLDLFFVSLLSVFPLLMKYLGSILEKFLLPSIKYGWLKIELITDFGNRFTIYQMTFKNSYFLFRTVIVSLFSFIHQSILLYYLI